MPNRAEEDRYQRSQDEDVVIEDTGNSSKKFDVKQHTLSQHNRNELFVVLVIIVILLIGFVMLFWWVLCKCDFCCCKQIDNKGIYNVQKENVFEPSQAKLVDDGNNNILPV